MLGNLFGAKERETEEHWVSISDVMAGLMVIFLFIAISYMLNVRLKADQIIVYKNEVEKLLDAYKNLQSALYKELNAEFEGSPTKKTQFRTVWRGHLDTDTIRFQKPFRQGDDTVPTAFKNVLRNFFPRYIAILTKPEYRDEVAEIRIEGHTSSEWFDAVGVDVAYYHNMKLSQDRARNVLQYVLEIKHPKIIENKEWIKTYLTANGLSSSKLIFDDSGNQNREASRRVEFRVVTKSEELISEIEQLMQRFNKSEGTN